MPRMDSYHPELGADKDKDYSETEGITSCQYFHFILLTSRTETIDLHGFKPSSL